MRMTTYLPELSAAILLTMSTLMVVNVLGVKLSFLAVHIVKLMVEIFSVHSVKLGMKYPGIFVVREV